MFAADFEPAERTSRRGSPRAPVALDVSIGKTRRTLCRVVDISINGARLQTYSALKRGTSKKAIGRCRKQCAQGQPDRTRNGLAKHGPKPPDHARHGHAEQRRDADVQARNRYQVCHAGDARHPPVVVVQTTRITHREGLQ